MNAPHIQRRLPLRPVLVACAASLAACGVADATILFATNGLTVLPSPPVGTIDIGALSAAWDEQQGVTISGLAVSMRPIAGSASDPGTPNPGTISGVVNSHIIHLSPVFGPWTGGTTSVTFDGAIVGVSYLWPHLMNSDFLSLPGPVFDPSLLRELLPGNFLGSFVQVNGSTITFFAPEPQPNWAQFRVLTVPAPSAAFLTALGAIVVGRRRR